MKGYQATVRRVWGGRARYGIWTGEDGPNGVWPLVLQSGRLVRDYGRPGKLVEVIGPVPTDREAYDLLAGHEKTRNFERQARWLRENFPDSFEDSATVEEALISTSEV